MAPAGLALSSHGMLARVNKAFTKEDEADAPAMVVPRAPLPAGVQNYVTVRGLAQLKDELKVLDEERARLDEVAPGADRSRALTQIVARRNALDDRLATAMLVDAAKQPRDEVRFGASVGVRVKTGALRTYEIVGVDEADPAAGRIAFTSPLARALLGKGVGDMVNVRTPRHDEELEIVRIEYQQPQAPEAAFS